MKSNQAGDGSEGFRHIANDLNGRRIAAVDMRRGGVDMDDRLVQLRVKPRGGQLDNIVAHTEQQIGLGQQQVLIIFLGNSDGANGIRVIKSNHALGHHCVCCSL